MCVPLGKPLLRGSAVQAPDLLIAPPPSAVGRCRFAFFIDVYIQLPSTEGDVLLIICIFDIEGGQCGTSIECNSYNHGDEAWDIRNHVTSDRSKTNCRHMDPKIAQNMYIVLHVDLRASFGLASNRETMIEADCRRA